MVANFTRPPEERLKMLFRAMLLESDSKEEWQLIPYRLSAQVIGEVIHLQRQTVSALESRLVREGVLKKAGRDRWVKVAAFEDLYDWIDRPQGVHPQWQ